MTVILLGPVPCATCRAPVSVVRRPVMIHGHELRGGKWWPSESPSAELSEVVMVGSRGRHRCAP